MGGGVSIGERGEIVVNEGFLNNICESRRPITVSHPRPGMCSIEVLPDNDATTADEAAVAAAAAAAAAEQQQPAGGGRIAGDGAAAHTMLELAMGDKVVLDGLKAEALNGRAGTIVSGLNEDSHRYDVLLDGGDERVVAVRPANLRRPPTKDDDRGPLAGIARLNAAAGEPQQQSPAGE